MKRATLIFAVLSLLLLADGTYMELTDYQPGDQDPLFGDPRFIMSDGTTVLIAGGMLLVVTVLMWLAAVRRQSRSQSPSPLQSQEERSGRSGGGSAAQV